jgi:hypothetical protein
MMRLIFAFCALFFAGMAMPIVASAAACPGYVAAEALRDKAVDDKVHSSKLTGSASQGAIANLKKGVASAEGCMTVGKTADRAAALAVIAQLRWNEACVLTFDGVPADKKGAIAVAKANDREIDAFTASHSDLSGDAQALFDNWEHFDGDIEAGQPDSCL